MKQSRARLAQWIVAVSAVMLTNCNGVINFDETTTAGKDFFLALFNTISQPPEIVLLIDTPSSDSASYTVETATGVIATGEINGTFQGITLSNSLQVGSSGYSDRNKGIRVSATGKNPIVVLATMKFSIYVPLGLDTYKVHQNVENEAHIYEYYALSTDYNGQQLNRKSEVLLVGNHNDTVVSITPTQTVSLPENAQNSTANLVSVASGSTHTLTLNQFQTLLVFNPTYDITGTRIVSNKPLTVLTGHQCAQFPTSATFCEPVHVQMPPTFLWGNEFLLAPFAGRTSQQQYKLVTAENSTTIVSRCGNSTAIARTIGIAGAGDYLVFPAGSYCSLFATKPIFVVQLGASYSTDNNGDPVMAVVPPTTRHVNYTTFRVSSLFPFMTNFVSITILKEHFGNHGENVLLDGSELSCSWNEIYNSTSLAGYGCNISTTTGKHFITHSNNGLLSVVAYGWSKSPAWGYAFLTGMSLKFFETTESSDLQTGEVQSVSYFDLSGFANLKELPREQEATSPPIYIPNGGLLFGTQIVTSVYVNENGLFSFNEPFFFSHPNQFPTDNIYSRLRNVVAPFWSDNDIRKNGTVRYVDIDIRYPLNSTHISEVLAHLRKTGTIGIEQEFQPIWMIVAQWDKVPPFSQDVSSKTNTYQGIIITDRVNTYYVFTYICGELQWSIGSGFDHAVVGYNSHGDYFYNTPGSGYENIADIVSCSFQVGSRRRRNVQQSSMEGMIFSSNLAVEECNNRMNNDRNSITDAQILQILEHLPECPPNSHLVQVDHLFEPYPTKAACYRSKIQVNPYENKNIGAQVQRAYVFAQQCCYYSTGGIITSGVDAGSLLELTSPHNFESRFYNSCCIESVMLCPEYRTRRPINNGSNYESPFTGSGFGDPHYITFDGYQHPTGFHGNGYHTVLKIEQNHNFTLQSDLDGLVMRSLAFGVQGVESYQFVHNGQPQVYNTTARNNPSTNLTYGVSKLNLFQLRKISSTSIEAIYSTKQIVLLMQFYPWSGGILSFEIQIPRSLCNDPNTTISGHLGNCDGNAKNDYVPNSHGMISDNSPEVLFGIFEGRKRRQAPNQLSNCTSVFACSENSSYVPPKFEDFIFTDAEIQFCNNVSTCLYDLAVTGSEELADSTRSIDENETRIMDILQNKLPRFNGTGIFKVTVGTESIYTFSVKDADDNFTVTILGGAPNGGQLVHNGEGMYTLRWMLSAIPTSSVTFRAEDARGAVVLLSPLLHVCSCFNGGTCTLDGVVHSDSLINMTCLCTEAYGGDSCTKDRNGCSEIECFEGVECFDVPAPGVGAVCGPCPPGYTGDGLRCFDIDECSVNNSSPCDQVCKNTVGGYACSCHSGYMLVSGSSQCQDIDECSGIDNNCQQQCNNTVGSYLCSCQSGFHLNADGATCSTQQTCTGANSCSHICAVIGGMEKCFCPVGLELAAGSTANCVDIDECVRFSPCDQVCNNSMGSYVCSCEGGYELEDMRTCQDVDECKTAALNNTQLCFDNTQCVNTPGSYNCTCAPGYILVNGKCERSTEMAAVVKIIIPSTGQNNSHTFVVQTYNKSELTSDKIQAFRVATADAINRFCAKQECTLMTSNGETQSMDSLHVEPQDVAILTTMITVSNTGRPTLFFYVQKDNDTFVSVSTVSSALQDANDIYRNAGFLSKDFCAQHTPCLNGGTCTSAGSDSGYTCTCATGYTGRNCTVHIDGCASNMCLNGGTCIRVGSDSGYTCACAAGYTGRNCTVHIDGCASNMCLNGGTCTSNGSDSGYTCTCGAGYTGGNCSVDIDDCASNPCQNGGTCTDGVGKFACTCPHNMMGDRCEQRNNINNSNPLPVIIGAVAGVLLLFLFVLVVATVYCILRRMANYKMYAMDSKKESRNIPMQERERKENVYVTVP